MSSIFGSVIGNFCGALYYILFQVLGYLIVKFLFSKEKTRIHIIGGSVLGTTAMMWLPVLYAFFLGFNKTSHILALMTMTIIYLAVFYIRKKAVGSLKIPSLKSILKAIIEKIKNNKLICVLMLALFILFFMLCSSHTLLEKSDGSLHTGQCAYGDMSMHLGFITSIASKDTFPPDYSIMVGEKLCYPFLCDSISSSIYIWGSSLRFAYIFPMLVAFLQVMFGFYYFAKEWLGKKNKAILAFFLYFLNGGLGFIYFMDWTKDGVLTVASIFTEYYKTPTNLIDNNIRWVNIIADMLLPQRATLFGYALLFTCIWFLYMAVYKDKKHFYPLCGVLVGAMPMVHTHSFLAIAFISAMWLLMIVCKGTKLAKKLQHPGMVVFTAFIVFMCMLDKANKTAEIKPDRYFYICILGIGLIVVYGIYSLVGYIKDNGFNAVLKSYLKYLIPVIILALPQLFYWTFSQASNSGFNKGQFNWGNLGDSYIWFYIKNWGIILLMLIPAIVRCSKKQFAVISGAFVIWFVLELIVFTPNPYDNNKLLYVVYLFFTCIAADYAVDLYEKLKISKLGGTAFLAVIFLVFASLSAVLTLGREYVSDYQVYSKDQVNVAEYVINNTDRDAVFLMNDRHVNEVTALAGRSVVSGAGLYLGPHGILDNDRVSAVREMFENPYDSKNLYEEYGVDYILISSWERNSYQIDESYFENNYDKVYSSGDINIYRYN